MPLLNDIMDHKVIGPAIRQGRKEGREEGSRETALRMVLRLIGDRFGPVPESTKKRLAGFPEPKLEQCAIRIMKARTIEDVLS